MAVNAELEQAIKCVNTYKTLGFPRKSAVDNATAVLKDAALAEQAAKHEYDGVPLPPDREATAEEIDDAAKQDAKSGEQSEPAKPATFFESIASPLAKRGWRVAPCYPKDKVVHTTLVPRPIEMRSNDPAQIHAWGIAAPDANVCVYAVQEDGGLCFVDKDGAISLRKKYEAETGKSFPKTLLVRSSVISDGSGGTITKGHWYFHQTPKTIALASNISEHKTGDLKFSFRVKNEYVASIGSIHPTTGQPYAIVEDYPVIPMPDDLLEWLQKQVNDSPSPKTETGERRKFQLHERYPALMSELGRLHHRGYDLDGLLAAGAAYARANFEFYGEEFNEELNAKEIRQYHKTYGDNTKGDGSLPPTMKPDAPASAQENYWFSYDVGYGEKKTAESVYFQYPAVSGSHRDFVAAPVSLTGGKQTMDGLFPQGSPSIIAGSSGTGKTTLIFEWLLKQRRGEPILGYSTSKRPFLVIGADRGKKSAKRTMERMGYTEGDIPTKFVKVTPGVRALLSIKEKIEEGVNGVRPEVVFLDGADMMVESVNNGAMVAEFLTRIQELCEHYHIALILGLGSPKQKKGQEYNITRDCILGSEKWGRMSETVILMQFVPSDEEHNNQDKRTCTVSLRNGAPEVLNLVFERGKLVKDENPAAKTSKVPGLGEDTLRKAKQWYLKLFHKEGGGYRKEVPLKEHKAAHQGFTFKARVLKDARAAMGIDYDQKRQAYYLLEDPDIYSATLELRAAS